MLDMHQNDDAVHTRTKLPLNGREVVPVVDPVGYYLGEPSVLSSASTSALDASESQTFRGRLSGSGRLVRAATSTTRTLRAELAEPPNGLRILETPTEVGRR